MPWVVNSAKEHGWLAGRVAGSIHWPESHADLPGLIHEPVSLAVVLVPWVLFAIAHLLRSQADPGESTMEDVVKRGMLDEVTEMIEQGKDINTPTASGEPLLHLAVRQGDVEMVRLLLDNGADFDVADQHTGMTPVLITASRGQSAILELLIRYGADIHATNPAGDTPLHLAAGGGHQSAVEVLLKYRPDIDAVNDSGISAQQAAEQNGHTQLAREIRQHSRRQWAYLNMSGG
jgi:ankyrin repeat protein